METLSPGLVLLLFISCTRFCICILRCLSSSSYVDFLFIHGCRVHLLLTRSHTAAMSSAALCWNDNILVVFIIIGRDGGYHNNWQEKLACD